MIYVFAAAFLAWLLLTVYFVVETAEGKIKPIIGYPLAFAICVAGLGTILSAGGSEPLEAPSSVCYKRNSAPADHTEGPEH